MNINTRTILINSRILLLETNMSEEEIAKEVFVSASNLRLIYKKYFGIPPKKYITKVKMKKAQTLLRTTKISISELATSLGYVNKSKFSERFKKTYNISPSAYRKNIKN